MNYVKHFSINGIDTKQVACIEVQGRPNAATEGAVGVLAMDMSSPTHEVYKCVAVNGSIYTWELLSAGMSIISSNITGEGGASKSFPYTTLRYPDNFLIKKFDLILDSEGYLYSISTIGSESCEATYTGTHFGGGSGASSSDRTLAVVDGQLALVTPNGTIISPIDYLLPDEATIVRDDETGIGSVRGIYTIGGTQLKLFRGTRTEYNALTDAEKANLFPIFTDDEYVTQGTIDDIVSGTTQVGSAGVATSAYKDGSGRTISSYYASAELVNEIVNGTQAVGKATTADSATTAGSATKADSATTAGSATTADSATKATQDGIGQNIVATYATKTALEEIKSGTQTVGKATTAESAAKAAWATKAEYATKAGSATTADSATKATQDNVGQNIAATYATKTAVSDIISGKQTVGKATTAESATTAGSATTADSATTATKATEDGKGNNIYGAYKRSNEMTKTVYAGLSNVSPSTGSVQILYDVEGRVSPRLVDHIYGISGILKLTVAGTDTTAYFSYFGNVSSNSEIITAPFVRAIVSGRAQPYMARFNVCVSKTAITIKDLKVFPLFGTVTGETGITCLLDTSVSVTGLARMSLHIN